MTTQTLHFTVGELAGKTITDIAIEKLYDLDYKGAVKTITESLTGIPDMLVLEILKGSLCINVDVDNQEFVVDSRTSWNDENNYPVFDFDYKIKSLASKIESDSKYLQECLRMFNRQAFSATYSYTLQDLIIGADYSDFEDSTEGPKEVIKFVVKTIDDGLKLKAFIEWVNESFEKTFEPDFEIFDNLIFVYEAIKNGSTKYEEESSKTDKMLDNYIESHRVIDSIEELKPVNILDNYSAGWLFPDGTYYGLNGEIANMLHNRIAEMLFEQGIISEGEYGKNHDQTLNKMGCVKIHGDHILFEGEMMHKRNSEYPRDITDAQKQAIYLYGQTCCMGSLRFGLQYKRISAALFQIMDKIAIRKLFTL